VSRSALTLFALLTLAGVLAAEDGDRRAARRTPVVVAVEKASPAIVNISTTRLQGEAFYRDWFGRRLRPRTTKSVGSGVIVHGDGYVVTNAHVVKQATDIVVTLDRNGRTQEFPARLLSANTANDIALLKITRGSGFPTVALGRSDDLMIGEPAIAVGNPFGVGKTVTTGVVSATGRSVDVPSEVTFEDFIQTDAAINPGNSGGALLNIHGEMIGLNTAIVRGGEGIGFAIPVARVAAVMEILAEEAVTRRGLGFRGVTEDDLVRVRAIAEEGPAARAGLEAGDVIEAADGRPVKTVFDLASPLITKTTGDPVVIRYRRNGKTGRLRLTIPDRPEVAYLVRRLGIRAAELPAEYRRRGAYGVLVESVEENGPAASIGMEAGDVISAVEPPRASRYAVRSVEDLASRLQGVRPRTGVELEVLRNGRRLYGTIRVR